MYIVFNKQINRPEKSTRGSWSHGDGVGIPESWCRELVVNSTQYFLSDMSIEELSDTTVTIFGICSHEFITSYQKSGWKKEYKGNPQLDNEMLRWFRYTVLLANQASLGLTPDWDLSLIRQTKHLEEVGMWQNEPPEHLQDLVDEIGTEKTSGRGGIYGVPAALLKSPPILSLLLYLPRLCESLNRNHARLWKLRDLTGGNKYRYNFPRALESIFRSFVLPTSFTDFGGAEFWTMYFLLTRTESEPNWLFSEDAGRIDGFCSGIHKLFTIPSFPEKVKEFYQDYKSSGFQTLVKTKQVVY